MSLAVPLAKLELRVKRDEQWVLPMARFPYAGNADGIGVLTEATSIAPGSYTTNDSPRTSKGATIFGGAPLWVGEPYAPRPFVANCSISCCSLPLN
jgi:hypothetical protein